MIGKSIWSLRVTLGTSCRKMKKGSMDLFQGINSKSNWTIFRLLPASLPWALPVIYQRHLKSIYSLPEKCFQCWYTFLQHASLYKLFYQVENLKPWQKQENIPRINRAKLSRVLYWQFSMCLWLALDLWSRWIKAAHLGFPPTYVLTFTSLLVVWFVWFFQRKLLQWNYVISQIGRDSWEALC